MAIKGKIKLTKEQLAKKYPGLFAKQSKETARPAGIPHHHSPTPHRRKPLKDLSDNRIEFLMYQVWKGYTIARNEVPGPKRDARLKYYAEGIDKIKTEMARRGMKDKHNRKIDPAHKATPFPKSPKLPFYSDGLWLNKGGKALFLSPMHIFKKP